MPEKGKKSLTVDEDIHDSIRLLAAHLKVQINEMVRTILDEYNVKKIYSRVPDDLDRRAGIENLHR